MRDRMRLRMLCRIVSLTLTLFAMFSVASHEARAEGGFVTKWGSSGTGDGQFGWFIGIAVDVNGNVYVADAGNNRIQKFNASGTFLTKWGSSGNGDGQFNDPWGVAVDSYDNVYVVDTLNHRIQKFSPTGEYITKLGGSGWGQGDGEFSHPTAVAIDSSGNIYVADRDNHRIQKFNSAGEYLLKWGSLGTNDGQFNGPESLAVDASGDIYVADRGNFRIQKFNPDGGFITKWGSLGTGDAQFSNANGIAVNASGDVYVTNGGINRIQKFSSTGTFLTKWGSTGTGDGQFDFPEGVAIGPTGNIFVCDHNNYRVQVFTPYADPPPSISAEYVMVDRVGPSAFEPAEGYYIVIGANVTPSLSTTTASASQLGGTNNIVLPPWPSPAFPDDYSARFAYDAGLLGRWRITVTSPGGTATRDTHALDYPETLPFAQNLGVSTSSGMLTPTLTWSNIYSQYADTETKRYRLQVRVRLAEDGMRAVYAGSSLTTTQTSFTIPSGILQMGQSYLLTLMFLQQDKETSPAGVPNTWYTESRSQTFLFYCPCEGNLSDLNGDGDADGSDLAALIASPGLMDAATFAQNFGRNTCP